MSGFVGFLDINFFEGQALALEDPDPDLRECIKNYPAVVVNSYGRILSINGEAKYYGINRDMRIGEAMNILPNIKILSIPYLQNNRPCRGHINRGSLEFFIALQEIKDELYPNIEIQYGAPDEAFLLLNGEVENAIWNNPGGPVINPNRLHWNTYLELARGQVLRNGIRKDCFAYHREYYFGAEIMTKFMDEIFRRTGFHVSAGLGRDRFDSKLATSINTSENSLTVFIPNAFQRISESMNISNVVGLKSGIGNDLKNYFGIRTLADLQQIPKSNIKFLIRNVNRTIPPYDLEQMVRSIRGKAFGTLSHNFRDNFPIVGEYFDPSQPRLNK